jgi:hypothetical protein
MIWLAGSGEVVHALKRLRFSRLRMLIVLFCGCVVNAGMCELTEWFAHGLGMFGSAVSGKCDEAWCGGGLMGWIVLGACAAGLRWVAWW